MHKAGKKGFGIEVVDKADLADKVFPNKETVSKPVKPGDEVHHYLHRYKHGIPLSSTGKPPVSRQQAIAIGLSEAKRGGGGGGKKGKDKATKTKKSIDGWFEVMPGKSDYLGGFRVEVVKT